MKKQILTLFAMALTSLAFCQTIPNGGFENWTTRTVEDPQVWMCANDENHGGSVFPPSVTKTTDAYHGTYAIKLLSAQYGIDTVQAYFANGNPGNNPPPGGVPYTQIPTGVRFYYKNTLQSGDSSLTLTIFKKNGAVIGQYFYLFAGNHSSYTLFSKTFSPALSQTPDTVIFACASSNLMKNKGYPGSMLQVDSVSFTGVTSQPANFNGDFELWHNTSTDILNGWSNTNSPVKTTDKYSGTYALELITNPPGFGNNQPQVGNISNTNNNHSGPPTGGSPYSTQIDTLVFYYKYLPANYPTSTDSAQVNMTFSKNGTWVWGTSKLLPYSLSYKKVEMPFNLASAPDTLQFSISSSKWPTLNSYIGSDLKVDQLFFKSQRIPVSKFSMPATGCKGVPIQLTDSSSNMPTSWQWFMTSACPSNNSNLQNPVITYTNTGTFTVSLQAADSFGTGAFTSKTITIYNNPVVSATSATVCAGHTASLTASGASTYTWNTGSTGATYTASPSVTTIYSVTGTSTVGCSGTATGTVFVPTPATPDICMVTVDSTSTNNIIYWDKTLYHDLDSMLIYREVSTNTYVRIGAVSKDSLSMFIDNKRSIGPANGDPNIGSYRYKLQIRDTCGNYGTLSRYHNTVYIIDQHNGNFTWNTYDVQGLATPVANFILERDNANNNIWSTVGTVSGTQTSLFDASYGSYQAIANWRVQATGFSCTPTARYGNNGTQAVIVKSKSNISNNRTTGIKENKNVLNVYPNPTGGMLTISLAVEKATADIFDLTGQKVASFRLQGTTSQIDVSQLSSGSYILSVNTGNGVYHQKITKTN
ncbi:MAG TPA: T9SS type A sorting domain-containing protein [Bacteroidia bacterium]|nr:T9SS type A sorting domain-containing protein [Bacteroidia bacterium]